MSLTTFPRGGISLQHPQLTLQDAEVTARRKDSPSLGSMASEVASLFAKKKGKKGKKKATNLNLESGLPKTE